MRAGLRFYQYINILSLDIAAGAVISAVFFAQIFNVQIKPYGLLALGLTVWIIYTVDHLRDAKKIKHQRLNAKASVPSAIFLHDDCLCGLGHLT